MANVLAAFCWLGFGVCDPFVTGERELRPPRAGIEVGSLYYVRERPTDDLSRPANLERLCSVNLARYGVAPKVEQQVADIDLLSKLEFEGALSGVQTQLVTAGLSGSLSNYFEYKLTNVKRTDISLAEAEQIFSQRAARGDCAEWRGNIGKNNWGIYQIQSISVGDVAFSRKNETALGAEGAVKLKVLEPKLKASIKNTTGVQFGGKALVVSFAPVRRN